jgi:hypothetical protein
MGCPLGKRQKQEPGGVAEVVEHLPSKHKAKFKPQDQQKTAKGRK